MDFFPTREDVYREIYRDTWLQVLRENLAALGESREDFGRRCKLVRQAYMEMADIVLDAARRGNIAEPYFLPWDQFWEKSPPEFDTWWSIRYYGLPLYPQYPILNYFVDFGDPWQRIGIEADGRNYHDEGKDLRRDEELFEIGWKVFRIPAAQAWPGYLGPNDEFRALNERAQRARLCRWLLETSDGIIQALKALYYERWTPLQYATSCGLSEEVGAFFIQRCHQTLDRHRLVKRFELPNDQGGNAWDVGVSLEELVMRSLAAYVAQAKAEPALSRLALAYGPTDQRCKTRRSGWPSCGTGNGPDDGPGYRRVHRSLSGAGSRECL